MDCKFCRKQLFLAEHLFFYERNENNIHLSLKPEVRSTIEEQALTFNMTNKFTDVQCKLCCKSVGKELPFAPNSNLFVAFSIDRIILMQRLLPAKSKWRTSMKLFPEIEVRTGASFFGVVPTNIHSQRQENEIKPIRFADPSNLKDFSCYLPGCNKAPKDYQMLCYVESLLRDLVVVLPTGSGKTLISTMLMRKMRELNPDHLVLFIVNTVPLVFQQGQVIENDSGLRLCQMCGENKSPSIIRQLQLGKFDGLVCTAGAFLACLQGRNLNIWDFSCVVMDECHHASGNHVYVNILKEVKKCPEESRPRILGLTASPVSVKSEKSELARISTCLKNLEPAAVFRPHFPHISTLIESSITFKMPDIIHAYITEAQNHFNRSYSLMKGYNKSCELLNNGNTNTVKGDLRKTAEDSDTGLFDLLESIQVCREIGIEDALGMISNPCASTIPGVQDLINKYQACQSLSPKLIQLLKLIEERKNSVKILVFVKTRQICKLIWKHVAKEFPGLNPLVLFGQNGYDGMSWQEQQQNIISKFTQGDCQMIITTSVVEEGIDVVECGLVIRYSCVQSVIQNIQSKGRARSHSGEYVVFTYEEERRRMEEIQENERLLDRMLLGLTSKNGLPSSTACNLIEELQKNDHSSSQTDLMNYYQQKDRDQICIIRLVFHCSQEANTKDLEERLLSALECLQLLSVDEISSKKMEYSAFSKMITYIVCARSFNKGIIAIDAYQKLCKTWNFSFGNDQNFKIWSQVEFPPKSCRTPILDWKLNSFSFGNFLNEQTYEEGVVIQHPDMMMMMMMSLDGSRKFEIKINGGEYKRTIILSYSSFLDFALLDWRDDGTVRVYLPYSSMPTLISHGEKTENLNLNFRCELDPLDKQILSAFEDNSVLVLALKFNSSDDDSYDLLQEVLKNPNYFPIGIYDSCVTVISDDEEEDLWDLFLKSSSTDIELNSLAWNLSAIKSQKNVAFSKATQRKVLKTILEAHNLESLILALNFYLFKGIDFPYWFNFDAALKMEFEAQKNLTKKVRNNTVLVGSVVITPTRTVYYPVMSVKQSRIHRKFPNNKFVIVAFRDENMDKLQGQESFKFVTYVLNNGLTLNGKRYNFFCGSASEQRSHKALFISSESIEEVNELRSMIVLNSQDSNSVPEFLSKLSLFCTADTPTFNLFPERWAVADDVSAENGDCLTEGAGLIRSSVASRIAHLLESNSIPSAYQVRFSGIKGVLLVIDDQFMDNSVGCEKDILIRKSMIKFESNDYNLGIVSFSKFIPVKLNREVITLLESISPIVVEELHVLQEKELSRLVEMLLNSQIASKKLKCSLANVWNIKEVAKYFDLASEPFWIQILKKLFDSEVTDIAKKAKILVEEAALAIGVADPFQILCDEEIFLQVQRSEDEEAVTVTGLVAIYRNPCLYPGDVRTVMAVDRAEFRSFKNVLIMPASPNCKYSLAAACSGGDLDGDLFAVIWNSRLVPPVSCIYPPLRYSKLKCDIPKHPTPCKHQALSEFYVKSLVNDVLGRVAHLHLALCDRREGGACDPLAMKVAESQAVAVDFPKTGIAPTVPLEAIASVESIGYPDFMEKKEKLSYHSRKIQGELHQVASSVHTEAIFSRPISLDSELIVANYEKFIRSAQEDYLMYSIYMKQIMYQYGLQDEIDIIIGHSSRSMPSSLIDVRKSASLIQDAFLKLKNFMMDKFLKGIVDEDDQKSKASAWYYVAYNYSISDSDKFISFAWIASDALCKIKESRLSNIQSIPKNATFLEIGNDAKTYFLASADDISAMMVRRVIIAERVAASICNYGLKIHNLHIDVKPYGSVTIFTCNSSSDLDLSLVLNEPEDTKSKSSHHLRTIVIPSLGEEVESVVDVTNAPIPHIKCSVLDDGELVKVDICINSLGLLKTELIQSTFIQTPHVLPVFWFLMKWARITGILRDNRIPTNLALMAAGDFYGLVLSLLDISFSSNKVEMPLVDFYNSEIDTINSMTHEDTQIIGQYLISFFNRLSKINEDFTIVWPHPKIPCKTINKDIMMQIACMGKYAFYNLIASRSCLFLIKSLEDNSNSVISYCIKLPLSLSRNFIDSVLFHSSRLSSITGAEVTLSRNENQVQVTMKVLGTRAKILRVYEEIQHLSQINRNIWPCFRVQRNGYFMANSDIFIVRDVDPLNVQLGFERSTGPFQLRHALETRSTLKVRSDVYLSDWKRVGLERFASHLFRQFATLTNSHPEHLDSLQVTTCIGNFYILNASSALPETRRSLSLSELERALAKRKNRKHHPTKEEEKSQSDNACEVDPKPTTINPLIHHPLTRPETKPYINGYKKKRNVTSSFCSGMNTENDNDRKAIVLIETIYREALNRLGYSLDKDYIPPYVFQLDAFQSKYSEVSVILDKNMKLIDARERYLRWVNCYILHGRGNSNKSKILENVDCRISCVTCNPISNSSVKEFFPDESSPIQIKEERVVVNDSLKDHVKKKISYFADKRSTVSFVKENIRGTISTGAAYEGSKLCLSKPICNLTLHYDNKVLREALIAKNRSKLRKFACDIFFSSVQLCESISDVTSNV